LTPNSDGCYDANPYKISDIKIYFIERDFNSGIYGEYNDYIDNDADLNAYNSALSTWCDNPTEANLSEVERLQSRLLLSRQNNTFYYKDANIIATYGTDTNPVWIDTGDSDEDAENALAWNVKLIDTDDDGNPQYGRFELEWQPLGMREGDYFICWTYVPTIGGDALSKHNKFSLEGATQLTTSIPTHETDPQKYYTLMDRYTPEMFKDFISDNDLTPQVLQEFNYAVGDGFRFLENFANQLVDLPDANAAHEEFLPYLSNMYGLKLRSDDPTKWRRQIKRAAAVFKKKGTLRGLTEALAQAGITLDSFTKLWQIVSPYTWQEVIDVTEDGQTEFSLEKLIVLPVNDDNFELYFKGVDDTDWIQISRDYVNFSNVDGTTEVAWQGDNLSMSPIVLEEGDSLRFLYEIVDVPTTAQQTIEEYIRTLPLMDQRNEISQSYPLKNWNVRLIEEDDSMFDVIVTTLHPYYDPVIFGWVRTEFPYNENIYNAEEYNGSTRESRSPCDIDRDFIDTCSMCQSSKFNINLTAENLTNDRILEIQEIIKEHTPFHSVLHQMNFSGGINEFIEPPVESLKALMQYSGEDLIISGNAQMIFNRVTEDGLNSIKRNELASSTAVASAVSGTASNTSIVLFAPDNKLSALPLNVSSNVLEVLTGTHIGNYSISATTNYAGTVSGVSEPLSSSSFTFRLSNDLYQNTSTNITQEFVFDDANKDFNDIWDSANPDEVYDGSWIINIPAYPHGGGANYQVIEILPSGGLLLDDFDKTAPTLPATNTTGISYTIGGVATSSTGSWTKGTRAIIDISSDASVGDVRNLFKIGNYILYSGNQYKLDSFIEGYTDYFRISGYTGGDAGGITINIYARLVDSGVGYFNYRGLQLETLVDYESSLQILNGVNAPVDPNDVVEDDRFKENFLIVIDKTAPSADTYYAIAEIDGTTITLNGPQENWTTTGTAVTFTIYKYEKQALSIDTRDYPPMQGHNFDQAARSQYLDRRGNDVVDLDIDTATPMMAFAKMMNVDGSNIMESIGQQEAISYKIEYKEE
jgi:hypothetical protein